MRATVLALLAAALLCSCSSPTSSTSRTCYLGGPRGCSTCCLMRDGVTIACSEASCPPVIR